MLCLTLLIAHPILATNTPVEVIWEFESSGTLMRSLIDVDNHDIYYRFTNGIPIKRVQGTDDFVPATTSELTEWLEFTKSMPIPTAPLDQDLLEQASLFKTIMTIHFGTNSVTNTNITERIVTSYFINRRLNGTSEPTDASDAMLLQKGFETLKSYTGDGTVWSFPWAKLEEKEL